MRLYPPAWLQMRFVAKESEIDGMKLPVGTLLILSQWVMHRLPEIWQDAEVFKPERWDPANEQHISAWSVFSLWGRSAHLHRNATCAIGSQDYPREHSPTLHASTDPWIYTWVPAYDYPAPKTAFRSHLDACFVQRL